MQLGLTIPLQRYRKIKFLPYGAPLDRLFCWDLHRISLHGRGSLLLVHCASRYACVAFDLSPWDWARLEETALSSLRRGLLDAGLPEGAVDTYLRRAGPPELTRTHGRREVAFLNRAWDDVLAHDCAVDLSAKDQPLLEGLVNSLPCRCAGEEGLAPAREHLRRLWK